MCKKWIVQCNLREIFVHIDASNEDDDTVVKKDHNVANVSVSYDSVMDSNDRCVSNSLSSYINTGSV